MAWGAIVRGPASEGSPIRFTLDDRLTRFLGSITMSAAAGSHTDAALLTGTPWYFIYYQGFEISTTPGKTVTITGDTISWTASTGTLKLIYGVY